MLHTVLDLSDIQLHRPKARIDAATAAVTLQ